nr:ANTAR domain-containing protein [Aeromicrobium stalagmiti]
MAAHVAVALASAQHYASLEGALASRALIGQAEGMLMQRYGLDGRQAFSVLVRMSQHGTQKLRDVAADLVKDGIPPGPSA